MKVPKMKKVNKKNLSRKVRNKILAINIGKSYDAGRTNRAKAFLHAKKTGNKKLGVQAKNSLSEDKNLLKNIGSRSELNKLTKGVGKNKNFSTTSRSVRRSTNTIKVALRNVPK